MHRWNFTGANCALPHFHRFPSCRRPLLFSSLSPYLTCFVALTHRTHTLLSLSLRCARLKPWTEMCRWRRMRYGTPSEQVSPPSPPPHKSRKTPNHRHPPSFPLRPPSKREKIPLCYQRASRGGSRRVGVFEPSFCAGL